MSFISRAQVHSVARSTVWNYYAFQFFFGLFLWLPIFYEFQRRIGLSDQQIFSIQSIYYWAFCLLEVPTGIMADRWGYRFCMRLGAITLVVAGVFPLIAQGYLGVLTHFLLIALSRSLISGAASAYLYEYLKVQGEPIDLYQRIEGNARAYSLIGKVLVWPCAGILMEWRLTLPYWLTLFANLGAVGFAYALPQFKLQDEVRASSKFLDLNPVFQMLWNRPLLPLIMVQGVAIFTLSRLVQINLFQPLLNEKGIPLSTHGLLMSYMTLFETWGAFRGKGNGQGKGLTGRFSDLNWVFIFTGVIALSLVLIQGGSIWIGLGMFSFATGASFPVQRQLINDAISDSRYRATVLSLESIIDRAVCAWVAGSLGSFVAGGGVGDFLLVSAGVSGLGVLALYVIIRWRIPASTQ